MGATSQKIEKAVKEELKNQNKKMKIHKCMDLRETVEKAKEIAVQGDIVLFSPAILRKEKAFKPAMVRVGLELTLICLKILQNVENCLRNM